MNSSSMKKEWEKIEIIVLDADTDTENDLFINPDSKDLYS